MGPVDRWALRFLTVWAVLVLAAVGSLILYEAATLAYPVARILFEDHFLNVGMDGRLLPREGESVTPALSVLVIAPVFWAHQMAYFPLANLLGSIEAITIERLFVFALYLLGTPALYRLLRHGKADVWVAVVLSATYAVSPFFMTRMLVCNSLPTAQFLLWSELGRINNRPIVRVLGLLATTFSYPLAGFSVAILAYQDYRLSAGAQRRTTWRTFLATAVALAIVHFGVLVLWPSAQPSLAAHRVTFDNNFSYPVFPFPLSPIWAIPVRPFEILVFLIGSCIFLVTNPQVLIPVVVDLAYLAGTGKGIRDHSTCLTTIGMLAIIAARAGLFQGGNARRNRALVAGALFATLYGHATAGPNGFLALAFAAPPPRPHLEDIAPCVPPNQKHCLVPLSLFAGFYGLCEEVTPYDPKDLDAMRIVDPSTTVFVARARLYENAKGRPYGPPESIDAILSRLAARIRSGELHASRCEPGLVLVQAAGSGATDRAAADQLDEVRHPK